MPDCSKMKYTTEAILLDSDFPFAFYNGVGFQADSDEAYMHNHVCLELNLAVSNGKYIIGENEYEIKKGDIFIINNYEYHVAFNASKGVMLKVIVFDADLVLNNESLDYQYIKAFYEWKSDFKHKLPAENPLSEKIARLFEEIEEEWKNQAVGYKLVIKAQLMKMLALIYRGFELSASHSQNVSQFQNDYIRIVKAIEYIDRNFCQELKLSDLAEMVHMNQNYFSTFFSKTMNCPVSTYILRRRLRKACVLLTSSKNRIVEIALDCGFNNVPYFNRTFHREFGITPQEYRKNLSKPKIQ